MAPGIAFAAALAAAFIGIHYGTYTAGDSDPYGYVSEADLIARGSLHVEQQFARTMPWPLAEWTFAPLGYRPAPVRGFIVPTYPPGLPLAMAIFQRIGGRAGVFYVVPLVGGLVDACAGAGLRRQLRRRAWFGRRGVDGDSDATQSRAGRHPARGVLRGSGRSG